MALVCADLSALSDCDGQESEGNKWNVAMSLGLRKTADHC